MMKWKERGTQTCSLSQVYLMLLDMRDYDVSSTVNAVLRYEYRGR
jgi:hypothetical protein